MIGKLSYQLTGTLLVAALTAGVLAGCNQQANNGPDTSPPANNLPSEPTTASPDGTEATKR